MASPGLVRAQDGFVAQSGGAALRYNVFDKDGKTFVNPAPDVAGSPFLKDDWSLGSIVVNTQRRYDSVKLRLNLLSQEVHFLDRNNSEMSLTKGYIKEILLPGRTPGEQLRFQNGFPPVDEQDVYNFYEVLAEGKLWLLHSRRKIIVTEKDEVSGQTSREFRLYEDYYLYDGKTMQRFRKEKATIGGKEMKFKTIDDLKKAIDAYNAL